MDFSQKKLRLAPVELILFAIAWTSSTATAATVISLRADSNWDPFEDDH